MDRVRLCILRSDGGIVSLAALVTEHSGAIEYDLLTKTGHELQDVGRSLSWGALASFIANVDDNSALTRELNDEYQIWATTIKTNGILADIYDVLSQINANLVALGERKPSKAPKPYPRPGVEKKQDNVKHFGSAVPRGEFRKWLEKKRRERNGRRT